MPSMNLTELAIRALKTDVQTDFWDTTTSGFGIRVGPKTKTFVLKHDNRRHTLGKWPHMSLKDARDAARGRVAAKHAPISALSFKDAAQRYTDTYCARYNKPSTLAETRRLLRRVPFKGRLDDI